MNTLFYRYFQFLTCIFALLFILSCEVAGQVICVERTDKVPIIDKNIYFCPGYLKVRLTAKLCTPATGTITYRWTYLNEPSLTNTGVSVSIVDTGSYEITITKAGTLYKDTFHIRYYGSPLFEIITNPLPLKCEGVPLTLRATKGSAFTSYRWFTSSDTTILSKTDSLPNVIKDTTYIVEARDQNKCIVADTFQVVQSPFIPQVDIGPKDTIVCEGSIIELINKKQGSYDNIWSTGETVDQIFVSKSGKYWLKARNAFRCTASDTINVLVVPTPKITPGKIFYSCFGSGVELGVSMNGNPALYQYEWSPKQYISNIQIFNPVVNPPTSMRYKVRVYTKSGCSDTSSVAVLINPKIIASVNVKDTSLCLGSSVLLKGLASGGNPSPLPSPAYTYYWQPATGLDQIISQNVNAAPLATTKYKMYVKDSKSCTDTVSVLIKVSEMNVSIAPSKTNTSCLGDSLEFNAVLKGGLSPFIYKWSNLKQKINGDNFPILHLQTVVSGSDLVKLMVTDQGGCSRKDSFSLSVFNRPVLSPITNSIKVCVSDTVPVPLSVTGGSGKGFTYNFIPNDGTLLDLKVLGVNVTGNPEIIGTRNFIIIARDDQSCESNPDTLRLETIPNYQVALGSSDSNACFGNEVKLLQQDLFNKGLLFSWTNVQGNLAISSDSILSITSAGRYKLTISNPETGCSSSGIKNINFINPPLNASVAGGNSICSNEKLLLTGVAEGNSIKYSWKTTAPSGQFEPESGQATKYLPGQGSADSVMIILTAKNICGFTETEKKILIYPAPAIKIQNITADLFIDSLVEFNVQSEKISKILWLFENESPIEGGTTLTHIFKSAKNYQITAIAKDEQGCQTKDTLTVTVTEGLKVKELFIPNVFSPASTSNDNNTLRIFGKNISSEEFDFKVYNKWGEIIYHTSNLLEAKDLGWNGNFLNEGIPVNVGLYTYTVKGKYTDGTRIDKAGSATLLK